MWHISKLFLKNSFFKKSWSPERKFVSLGCRKDGVRRAAYKAEEIRRSLFFFFKLKEKRKRTCKDTNFLSIRQLKVFLVVGVGFEPTLGETFATAHSDASFSRLRCLSISLNLVLTYPPAWTGTCPKSRLGSQDRIRTYK